ncbi:rhamnan synthesis F family protein [Acidiphilium iwatense]|uniref:Rhamnan synthesis F family protein n=1 Tax=Acidiphilium iwatense TaxID=768198 RepID=A0ABS9DVY3_9PROT|nr:rhamnan synthesis F family protein [Acidiphilium iwatense]MCF3945836.1 rhamnan synthesis F family protein [Acidiphilium iwatense]
MLAILRKLKLGFGAARAAVTLAVAGVLGRLRSAHQVVASKPTTGITLGPKVVLFLHWDRGGRVREALFTYIAQLAESGRSVVFVTNAGKIEPTAEARLLTLCAGVLVRRNIGYDFGGWRDAIETLDLPRTETEEIIIVNDSVFGPVRPLEATLLRLDYEHVDVWGLTESWQRRYHLQSYFVAFGPRAIRSPAFRKFWAQVIPAPSKAYVIGKYEVGMTQAMIKAGLRVAVLWPYEALTKLITRDQLAGYLDTDAGAAMRNDPIDLTRWLHILRLRDAIARRKPLNPTSDLWRHLLLSGYPFIKRELLRDNPTRVEDVGDWADVLRDTLGVDPAPIIADLRTMLRGDAP